MRLRAFVLFAIIISASCSVTRVKNTPVESVTVPVVIPVGIDPVLKPDYDQFIKLSKRKHLSFSSEPAIQMIKITKKSIIPGMVVIGTCHRATPDKWIDIDKEFWENATDLEQKFTLWHELAHCMCGRDHDWAEGKEYKEKVVEMVLEYLAGHLSMEVPDGYYDDMCPLSAMHPSNNDDDCYKKHYTDYVKEIFNRCKPI